MSNDVKVTDREYARRIVAEHFGYDVVEDVSDQCSEVEFVLMGIKAGRGQPEREAVLRAEWKRPCEACDGEGWIERGDMPLHHLHSEAPEYGKSDCGECDGEGWSWSDDDVPLAECPIGLFRYGDTLALKTEYGNNEGRIDAYIVPSGEFFWGAHPQSIASQRATLVRPITEIAALTTPAPAVSRDELVAVLEEGNRRGLYDTTKIGPELVAFLDDRRGMLASLRDEMSDGYRGWLDDAVDALRIASERLAALTTPAPAVKPHCSTCGKDVAEVLCETCGKWWADNPPPAPAVSTDEVNVAKPRLVNLIEGGSLCSIDGDNSVRIHMHGLRGVRAVADSGTVRITRDPRAVSTDEIVAALEDCLNRESERASNKGDCDCNNLSRDASREYETGTCPHQRARAILSRLRGEGE
jgi:hypothetical protein